MVVKPFVCPLHNGKCGGLDGRNPHAVYNDLPSNTQQQFKDECDINTIINRVAAGGELVHLNPRPGVYGDFTEVPDYRQAFDIVQRAQSLFMDMPWNVRERFANDPQKMVQFLMDPENRAEAIKLGLVVAPPLKADVGANGEKAPDGAVKK